MPHQELLRTALRVLSAFTTLPRQAPDPADVEQLRETAAGEEKSWEADELASFIIQREMGRKKSRGAPE